MRLASILILTFSISANSQELQSSMGKHAALIELNAALSNQQQHNVLDEKTPIIKNQGTAEILAECILFDIYGKENIEKQKPYNTYLVENYWVISGTQPDNSKGGTFLIIIDSKTAKVLRITHGK